jgi:hypothetical protein
MDEIEAGYAALIRTIGEAQKEKEKFAGELAGQEGALLARMVGMAAPLVGQIGMNLLKKGRQDQNGEIFNAEYYRERMIVLGKTEPMPYRPDNPAKKVDDQFCALNEKGELVELMYSADGQTVDSYACPLDPEDAFGIYGYEVMLMLYQALREYLKGEEELVAALGTTVEFLRNEKKD